MNCPASFAAATVAVVVSVLPADSQLRGSLIEAARGNGTGYINPCVLDPEGARCPRKTGYELYAECRDLDPHGNMPLDCASSLFDMKRILESGKEQRTAALACVPTDIDSERVRRIFVIEAERTERILPYSMFDAIRYSLAKAFQCEETGWKETKPD